MFTKGWTNKKEGSVLFTKGWTNKKEDLVLFTKGWTNKKEDEILLSIRIENIFSPQNEETNRKKEPPLPYFPETFYLSGGKKRLSMDKMTEILQKLYADSVGTAPESITALAGAGSNRRYYRLEGGQRVIGVVGTSVEENRAFIAMARHFRAKGIPVPQIIAVSDDRTCYLQEDLGSTLLFDAIRTGRETGSFSPEEKQLLRKTMRLLPRIQYAGADGFDFSCCYPLAEFNRRSVMWDLNYFKYCFLKATGVEFQEDRLEDDFERMAEVLLHEPTATFMYRDFQSRNVMIREGEPYFIDFQGGRRGPVYYDVASFLWQAKANYPETLRNELLADYLDALRTYAPVDEQQFRERLRHFVLFRTLQVLGAYGFRGYFERKAHFLQSVPYAIRNLRRLLETDYAEYPYLCHVLKRLTQMESYKNEEEKLKITIVSFSYKRGIPTDDSGHGGGYVFDCRAIHNPGRYAEYQSLTGLDEPVVRFLEEDGEVRPFLDHVYALVDASTERYRERGFTDLMVAFGCTGGQHRSVYAAQRLGEHLHRKYGLAIHIIHREQNIEQYINPSNI